VPGLSGQSRGYDRAVPAVAGGVSLWQNRDQAAEGTYEELRPSDSDRSTLAVVQPFGHPLFFRIFPVTKSALLAFIRVLGR